MTTPSYADKVTEVFAKVDDFCHHFEHEFKNQPTLTGSTIKKRNRKATLCDLEIIPILIIFHCGKFRNFKHYYLH